MVKPLSLHHLIFNFTPAKHPIAITCAFYTIIMETTITKINNRNNIYEKLIMETIINSGIGTIRRCPQSAIIMQLISLQLVTNKSRAINSNSQIYATH
jgi:hypothetical protein